MATDKNASFITDLKRAARGLTFQSESDYPVEPFTMKGEGRQSLSAKDLIEAEHLPAGSAVKELNLDGFFGNAMQEQEWQDAAQRKSAGRFRKLVQTLKENLTDIKVYRIGDVEAAVYVIGRSASGDFAGVKTRVVET
jgi:hypothetical protein